MKRKITVSLILIVLILLGCQSNNDTTQSTLTAGQNDTGSITIMTSTITSTIHPTEVSTVIPSYTPTEITTVTITPSSTNRVDYSEKCVEVLSEIPLGSMANGQVILTSQSDQITKIYDFSEKTLLPFPNPSNNWSYSFIASPDREQLAFFRSTMNGNQWIDIRLMVMDTKENILVEYPGPLDTWENINWLGNDKIVLGIDFYPVVINPFNLEEPTLSGWLEKSPGNPFIGNISWDTWGVFDSSLNTILYIDNDSSLIFWDIENEQILAKLETPIAYMSFEQPKWSPDESQIVFPFIDQNATDRYQDELYSLSRDGSLIQLTHLNDFFSDAIIRHFNWSPDGRYIAFIFTIDNNMRKGRLGVYDFATGHVIDYCNLPGPTGAFSVPIWSPDSASIILERDDSDIGGTKSTILVDIVHGIAVKIAEHLVPEAWIVSAP